jgi:hypothetical protein
MEKRKLTNAIEQLINAKISATLWQINNDCPVPQILQDDTGRAKCKIIDALEMVLKKHSATKGAKADQ